MLNFTRIKSERVHFILSCCFTDFSGTQYRDVIKHQVTGYLPFANFDAVSNVYKFQIKLPLDFANNGELWSTKNLRMKYIKAKH